MSDLLDTLPDFDIKPYSHLLHSLEKKDVTLTDLITLDPVEIARKCPLPLLDVRRLVSDVIETLQKDLKMLPPKPSKLSTSSELLAQTSDNKPSSNTRKTLLLRGHEVCFVKTLDRQIDQLLCGGLATGYVTEVVGESAVGKTQFIMGLLLSVQLPSPLGLGKGAIYLSTEDRLSTARLKHMLDTHPAYQDLSADDRPSFDHVHCLTVQDLEVQQRIIEFQLPIAIKRYNVGLVALDSVAANFRADHETSTVNGLVDRAADLVRLGSLLRRVAVEHQVVVVVANQVSDRFADNMLSLPMDKLRTSSPAISSTPASQSGGVSTSHIFERSQKMTLDHQQRFFTGWGDKLGPQHEDLKTPALGLAWANQISARLVLKMDAVNSKQAQGASEMKRRRFMSLVSAPWAPSSLRSIQYSIETEGLVSMEDFKSVEDHVDLLDESLWEDDDEFP